MLAIFYILLLNVNAIRIAFFSDGNLFELVPPRYSKFPVLSTSTQVAIPTKVLKIYFMDSTVAKFWPKLHSLNFLVILFLA